ncbi:MBL fold metallo-hydrolase [Sporosarcina thermotolerans]|uniref:MBL fold metallo-hydrolase n=1 Tax=Sporosarcina thermotolerans TaxID=633404 RepID=A0AAW9A8H3_9BACL|nr:MBL fold metallo-hydrolase [Sporosarcina thermotolerans]MDW0117344.1 MBL fold metallo-hydrolase [Sporosarcina thermotolerans]WHT47494.1 MBL fold metallo-hydrolase [Sporosarcina thermotolerans]
MLKIRTYPLGPIQTNCYIVKDSEGQCLVVDPGEEGSRIIQKIENMNGKPLAILLTHAHFDHIGAVDEVRDHFSIPVYIHREEQYWLMNPDLNGSSRYPGLPLVSNKAADHFLQEGQITIGPFQFEIRHTPGHSPGSVSFIFKDAQFAIVGDTLFKQSIGRTDLPNGDTNMLLNSIQGKLLSLPDDCKVYPGHGPSTTPGAEKVSNPFLK